MEKTHRAEMLAHASGLPDDEDDQPITGDYREDVRDKIAQGVRSLREGRVIDGPVFMARMDAELAELERQGR